jgi:hypothetical protein
LLEEASRAHSYEGWVARTVYGFSLLNRGRVGEAARLFQVTNREAHATGDELAVFGGDWCIGYLVHDDVAGAERLLAHKRETLSRLPSESSMHEVVTIEAICCGMYEGRGAEMLMLSSKLRGANIRPYGASAVAACCALQAMAAGQGGPAHERLVRRTARALRATRRRDSVALAAQLTAALELMAGHTVRASKLVAEAADGYASAGMQLHEALMRGCHGTLQASDAGRASVEHTERFMRAQGIVDTAKWARMLAPGLTIVQPRGQ